MPFSNNFRITGWTLCHQINSPARLIRFMTGVLNPGPRGLLSCRVSFKAWSNSPTCNFLVILKTLFSLFKVCLIRFGAKLCRNVGPEIWNHCKIISTSQCLTGFIFSLKYRQQTLFSKAQLDLSSFSTGSFELCLITFPLWSTNAHPFICPVSSMFLHTLPAIEILTQHSRSAETLSRCL